MSDDDGTPNDNEVVVCTPARLKTLMASVVKAALGASQQILVDKQTLAQRLSCSAAHIDHLRKKGLPVVRVGEAIRFDPRDVMEWLRRNSGAAEEAK